MAKRRNGVPSSAGLVLSESGDSLPVTPGQAVFATLRFATGQAYAPNRPLEAALIRFAGFDDEPQTTLEIAVSGENFEIPSDVSRLTLGAPLPLIVPGDNGEGPVVYLEGIVDRNQEFTPDETRAGDQFVLGTRPDRACKAARLQRIWLDGLSAIEVEQGYITAIGASSTKGRAIVPGGIPKGMCAVMTGDHWMNVSGGSSLTHTGIVISHELDGSLLVDAHQLVEPSNGPPAKQIVRGRLVSDQRQSITILGGNSPIEIETSDGRRVEMRPLGVHAIHVADLGQVPTATPRARASSFVPSSKVELQKVLAGTYGANATLRRLCAGAQESREVDGTNMKYAVDLKEPKTLGELHDAGATSVVLRARRRNGEQTRVVCRIDLPSSPGEPALVRKAEAGEETSRDVAEWRDIAVGRAIDFLVPRDATTTQALEADIKLATAIGIELEPDDRQPARLSTALSDFAALAQRDATKADLDMPTKRDQGWVTD